MKLSKLVDIGVTIGAAALVGLNALQHKHKEEETKRVLSRRHHVALYSSLIAVGLALWDIKRHHHLGA